MSGGNKDCEELSEGPTWIHLESSQGSWWVRLDRGCDGTWSAIALGGGSVAAVGAGVSQEEALQVLRGRLPWDRSSGSLAATP
jgi:hypothetical protein